MARSSALIGKYLSRFGAAEAVDMPPPAVPLPPRILVVPLFDEDPTCLESVLGNVEDETCVIAVVNAPSDALPEQLARNEELLARFGSKGHLRHWGRIVTGSRTHPCLLIDRSTRPLPRKHGVGGARRIGMDTAAALHHANLIETPWIHTTDADARLPRDYFSVELPNTGLALFPFKHESADPILEHRARMYEQHMQLYREQLAAAGSPYAFTALGSAMTVHASTYASVRGMPRKDGAEDFHFANKVAKVSKVISLPQPTIELQARLSHRVPFGTGPTLKNMPNNEKDYLTYNPASFIGLNSVLTSFAADHPPSGWPGEIAQQLGLHKARAKLANQHQGAALEKALHIWFDGLKTLQFIHRARAVNADVPLRRALSELSESLCGRSHG